MKEQMKQHWRHNIRTDVEATIPYKVIGVDKGYDCFYAVITEENGDLSGYGHDIYISESYHQGGKPLVLSTEQKNEIIEYYKAKYW